MINLPGGKPFDENDLVNYILESGRDFIIQGQAACHFHVHPKPNSLDWWLRKHHAKNWDTKMAVDSVIRDLIATRLFSFESNLRCPDSGRVCQGLRLVVK